MRSSSRPFSLLLPLISLFVPALGQDQGSNSSSYVQECVQALQDAGFTQLATVLTQVNETTPAQALFAELSSGKNYTVFAPDNQAFQNVSSEISSNTTLLAEYLSYHFVNGNFQNTSYTNTSSGGDAGGATSSSSVQSSSETSTSSSESQTTDSTTTATETATATTAALFGGLFGRQDQGGSSNSSSGGGGSSPQPYAGIWPNVTIGRTLLNASDLVHLEGNKSQVLAWTRSEENGNVTILNQALSSQNITVVNATTWKNLFINGINGVLIPPGNLTTALSAVNATAAQTLLSSVQVPTENGTNATALEALQTARGITLFVPDDEAFTSEVNQTLQGLQNNQSAQANLVQNHFINGTTLYSTQIANNSQAVTAAGEPLTFSRNDTGLFVSGANGSTAQIVRPDVLLENGVAHIIDRVLLVESVDTSAASDAYATWTPRRFVFGRPQRLRGPSPPPAGPGSSSAVWGPPLKLRARPITWMALVTVSVLGSRLRMFCVLGGFQRVERWLRLCDWVKVSDEVER
ncbi:hypothetical protein CVT25_005015 [Psilocybe cyanescens]|uniref:FAS1 domain-containing protein n=1 Tax=Psilocybe cyanescens TaxID=93625 RepID=A0A409XIW7_PSICY|nr:hypothetical protein CVT25_005015 [Psilocybe cyanescens]